MQGKVSKSRYTVYHPLLYIYKSQNNFFYASTLKGLILTGDTLPLIAE
jgi:hypothetical protein